MSQILFESLYEDLHRINEGLNDLRASFVDAGKVSEEEFNFFADSDPTPTKKYLQWMLKNYLLHKDRKRHIIDMVNLFDKKVNKGLTKNKDIFSYSFESLDEELKEIEGKKTKTEIRKEEKIEGAEKVFENDKVLVISPSTHKASCYYGAGTKWCTAGTSPGYFNNYKREGIKLYYIMDKKENEKYAVAVYPNAQEEAFLANDKLTTRRTIEKKIGMDLSPYIKPFPQEEIKKIKKQVVKQITEEILSRSTKNNDGSYDVEGAVYLGALEMTKLPIKFNKVTEHFDIYQNKLTSLEGAPTEVGGRFYCGENKLTSLEGAPRKVGGDFHCGENKLTSLEGAPEKVGGDFYCGENKLTSLEGAPEKVGQSFNCSVNQLTSLEGAPRKVGQNFDCSYNQLTSLEGAPRKVGWNFDCSYNQLTSLEGAPEKLGVRLHCDHNAVSEEELKKTVKRRYLK